MIIHLHGVNFINKGAELMMHAIIHHLKTYYPEVILAADFKCGSFKQREGIGLYHLAWRNSKKVPNFGKYINLLFSILPKKIRMYFRIVLLSEINIVIDASGFVYSDQQDIFHSESMAKYSNMMKSEGKKIILLPQAFGPFENKRNIELTQAILNNCDLVFAREKTSYAHIIKLDINKTKVKIAPDFTNLISGICPKYFDKSGKRPCIIPNFRMVDKTSKEAGIWYITFLVKCISFLSLSGMKPFILIHEENDDIFIKENLIKIDKSIQTIKESNPIYIKGIIGNSYIVISSRYHGLVSSLSQGVPSLATSWSHKYQDLLKDFECPECLISINASDKEVKESINRLIDVDSRKELKSRLKRIAIEQKKLTLNMWEDVHKIF